MCCLTSVFLLLKDGRLTFSPGDKVVQLPYINYMREMGAVFLNSYTNSPICCPSRAGRVIASAYCYLLCTKNVVYMQYRNEMNILMYLNVFCQLCGVASLCI